MSTDDELREEATRKRKVELQRKHDEALRWVLSGELGRLHFWALLERAGLYSSSYAEKAEATAFNEGRRSIAIGLLTEAQRVAPELYLQALKERHEAATREQHEAKKREAESSGG
ncbi:MAG: hypothetical protein QM817_10290 [Archangium sp.]